MARRLGAERLRPLGFARDDGGLDFSSSRVPVATDMVLLLSEAKSLRARQEEMLLLPRKDSSMTYCAARRTLKRPWV